MSRFLNFHFMLAFHLVVIAAMLTGAAWYAHIAKAEVRKELHVNIDRQISLMSEIAEITDRNGADKAVEAIIMDCPRRTEFELLLMKLGTLPRKDLIEVQQLFESCGNFYAERKALMVSRFEREFDVLKDNVNLLTSLDNTEDLDVLVEQWNGVIALEQERSGLLGEQTELQREIISSLIGGKNVQSKEVADAVQRAQKVNESLGVLDKQIDGLRSELGT